MLCYQWRHCPPKGGPAEAGAHSASNLSLTLKHHSAWISDGLAKKPGALTSRKDLTWGYNSMSFYKGVLGRSRSDKSRGSSPAGLMQVIGSVQCEPCEPARLASCCFLPLPKIPTIKQPSSVWWEAETNIGRHICASPSCQQSKWICTSTTSQQPTRNLTSHNHRPSTADVHFLPITETQNNSFQS